MCQRGGRMGSKWVCMKMHGDVHLVVCLSLGKSADVVFGMGCARKGSRFSRWIN